jgi:hypothetical protein
MFTYEPKHRVPSADKQKQEWYKPMCDFIINKAIAINDKELTARNIEAANGIIDAKTFEYVVSPLKKRDGIGDIADYLPGKIRDVDFITPIKENSIGEYMQLPYTFHVKVNNGDAILLRDKKLQETIFPKLQEAFIALIKQTQQQAQQQKQQPQMPDFKAFADDFIKKYIDDRAIRGQKRINLLNDINNFEFKRMLGFFYWWATEEYYTYRYIVNDQVYTDIINPLEGFPIDNGEEYVEDMDGFLWISRISINEFIDKHRHEIDPKDWDYIDSLITRGNVDGPITVPISLLHTRYGESFEKFMGNRIEGKTEFDLIDNNRLITRYIACYKTEKLIKILTYLNAMGEITTKTVDETYILNPELGDIKIEEEWINEFYIQKRFGDDRAGVYTKPQPCLVQRRDPNNKSICKSPFGGKKGIMNGMAINPIPHRLIPYLVLYRIMTLHIERTIAKFKAAIILIPKMLLNDDAAGTIVDKWTQMLADNSLVYDDSEVDFNTIAQGVREIGVTQAQSIERFVAALTNFKAQIKAEAQEISHMSDARVGEAPASGTATTNQQNLAMARLGSALMIYVFNEALRREHQADLEWSKVAWIDGTAGSYIDKILHDTTFVKIEPGEDYDTNWGVYVTNSKLDNEKLEQLSKIAFAAAQNDRTGLAAKIIAIDNIPELCKILDEYEKTTREFESSMKDKDTQKEEVSQQHEDERLKATLENKIELANIKEAGAKDREMIKAISSSKDGEGKEDLDKYVKLEEDKLELQKRELALKEHDESR